MNSYMHFCINLLLLFISNVHCLSHVDVFMVAHSHQDTGWLQTVDEYYENEVQYIYDSVVVSLLENPDRKFISVEMAFFSRWWNEQTESRKADVHRLVTRGQLVFVNGGWCMNDEATSHFIAVINQMTEGHLFIANTFGFDASVLPRVGWHIDPFGSSRVTALLWAYTKFDAFVIDRIDYRITNNFKNTKSLEFIWKGLGAFDPPPPSTTILTHVLDSFYGTPGGFDFESNNNGNPAIVTIPPSLMTNTNIESRADTFMKMVRNRAKWYATNNILIPYGGDFNYQNANMKYKNMDKLISYINKNQARYNATIQYSILNDYFDAIQQHKTWPEWQDDFFPNAYPSNDAAVLEENDSYWTGYFSSRSRSKDLTRQTDTILRTAEFFHILARIENPLAVNDTDTLLHLELLRKAQAVFQHHDAVSGTEKQHVADDYVARMKQGAQSGNIVIETMVKALQKSQQDNRTHIQSSLSSQVFADSIGSILNKPRLLDSVQSRNIFKIIEHNFNQGKDAKVTIVNSLARNRTEYVSLLIPSSKVQVFDASRKLVPFQLNSMKENQFVLWFLIQIAPLGICTYTISPLSSTSPLPMFYVTKWTWKRDERSIDDSNVSIQNEYIKVNFNSNGLESIADLKKTNLEIVTPMSQEFVGYEPFDASKHPTNQTSGAYIFRPRYSQTSGSVEPIKLGPPSKIELIDGPLIHQVVLYYTPNQKYPHQQPITMTFRLYSQLQPHDGEHIAVDQRVGPIDITIANDGLEIATRFSTSIQSGEEFYTDLNGLLMQKRKRLPKGRHADMDPGVALAGNYYPVVSQIFIRDDSKQLTVLTDYSHGGTSHKTGGVELMLHRRLLHDDMRGVAEPLNVTTVANSSFLLTLNSPSKAAQIAKHLSYSFQYPMSILIDSSSSAFPNFFSPLRQSFPENLILLSLESRHNSSTNEYISVIRLLHPFAPEEDVKLSQPVVIDLGTIFASDYIMSDIQEVSLTLMHQIHAMSPPYVITMTPLQIRTFVCKLSKKKNHDQFFSN